MRDYRAPELVPGAVSSFKKLRQTAARFVSIHATAQMPRFANQRDRIEGSLIHLMPSHHEVHHQADKVPTGDHSESARPSQTSTAYRHNITRHGETEISAPRSNGPLTAARGRDAAAARSSAPRKKPDNPPTIIRDKRRSDNPECASIDPQCTGNRCF